MVCKCKTQIAASRKDLQRSVVFNPCCQHGDAHDELFLAYRFLNRIGVDHRYVSGTYQISTATLVKLLKGKERLTRNRELLYQIFMHELEDCYSQTSADIVRQVMFEVCRVHAKFAKK